MMAHQSEITKTLLKVLENNKTKTKDRKTHKRELWGKKQRGHVLTRLWLEGNIHPSRIQLCYYLGEVGGRLPFFPARKTAHLGWITTPLHQPLLNFSTLGLLQLRPSSSFLLSVTVLNCPKQAI